MIADLGRNERLWATGMLHLAAMEGQKPGLPEIKIGKRKTRPRKAGPETIAMMRVILAEGEVSTYDLADAIGIENDAASWRLRSLARADVVKVVGKTRAIRHRPNHIWALGPRSAEWLKHYEVAE